jgi:hypothetical protein
LKPNNLLNKLNQNASHNQQETVMKTANIIALTLTTLAIQTPAQDFVQKQGDTMTGTLTLQAQDGIIPALQIQEETDQWKFFRLENTQDNTRWDITMDKNSNALSFWYSAPGIEAIHFSIDTNGVIYGNGAGLTNLNLHVISGSLAIGDETQAIGNNAFAIGTGTTASLDNAHAQGWITTASGWNAHAQGGLTTASETAAHAQGWRTAALGWGSHAQGGETIASNQYAHAQGFRTAALGDYAHAQGYRSIAAGIASHAAGHSAIVSNDYSFVWSSSTTNETPFASTTNRQFSVYADNGIRLHTGPDATIEIAGGHIVGDGTGLTNLNVLASIPDGSISLEKIDANIPVYNENYGIEIGNNYVTARGLGSTGIGNYVYAPGLGATAIGRYVAAIGDLSSVRGYASTALGRASTIIGSNSRAEGDFSTAIGTRAYANHDNTYVWSSGRSTSDIYPSTTNRQFSVYADNGIRLHTGPDAAIEMTGHIHIGHHGDIPMFGQTP